MPASHYLSIYHRRAEHLAKRGVSTLGLAAALADLHDLDADVQVAKVHTDQWNFVLFINSESADVEACFAVDASVANAD